MTKLVRTVVALLAALLCGVLAFVLASPTAAASISTNSSTPAPTTVVPNCEADVKLLGKAATSASAVWHTTRRPALAPGVHRPLPSFGVAAETGTAGRAGSEAFHYTRPGNVASILDDGLRPGTYATPNGRLSGVQAQIDLALSPNRGLSSSVLRVDLDGLRAAGFRVPEPTLVTRSYGSPGGGYEMRFPYAIPPEYLKVIR